MTPFLLAGTPTRGASSHTVRAPWDGRDVTEVALAGPEHIAVALDAAVAALPALSAESPATRADRLRRLADAVRHHADAFVADLVHEAGKPVTLARAEVERALDTLADAAHAALTLAGHVEPLDAVAAGAGRLGLVRYAPKGVVAAITPFNFPLNLVMHKLAPALAAGCPVILKPASDTPSAALRLGNLIAALDLPPGALSVLPMRSEDAAALITDPRVAVLSFTGSGPVGWALRQQTHAATVMLELGGAAFNLVHIDADLAQAAKALAVGAMAYAGQSCVSVQHVRVHREVARAFRGRLLEAIDALPVGDPADPATLVGPVLRARDADRIEAWIEEAIDAGAVALRRGRRKGNLLHPTVLADVPPGCRLSDDEAFGPVVTLGSYTSLHETFAEVNRSRFGLQASIFTRDLATLMRAHAELHVGGVIHNAASSTRLDGMPYGGIKHSGIGREGPRHAVRELSEPRLLLLDAPAMSAAAPSPEVPR